MSKKKKNEFFVIGVDGGGTKTVGVLATNKGKIQRKIEISSTNPNKIGFKRSIFNLKRLLKKLSKGKSKKIKLAYLGLAGGLERDEGKRRKIEKELQKFFPFKIVVEGDQIIAFRAATNEKNGIVVIAGTGAIAMGWKGGKKAICGGWDWLIGDQGSAFWVGKRVLEEVAKSMDKRVKKLAIEKYLFEKFKIKKESDLYKFYDPNFVEKVASIAKIVDRLAKKGDSFSKKILTKAAKELTKMTLQVIRTLKLKNQQFPLVLVGGMFKSKILSEKITKEIKKIAPKTKIFLSQKPPVFGAIKLALEAL